MQLMRRVMALCMILVMLFSVMTAHATDLTTPQSITTDTVLEVDGSIIVTDFPDEAALSIDGNSSGAVDAQVSVSDSIETSIVTAGGSETTALYIENGYDSSADVTVGQNISATADTDGTQATGLQIYAGEASGTVVETENGSLVVNTDGDNAPAKGAEIWASQAAEVDISIGTADGGIEADSAGEGSLVAGAEIHAGQESSITVNTGNNGIQASADKYDAVGLDAEAELEGSVTVTTGEDGICAEAGMNAQGVDARASEQARIEVDTGDGGITAVSTGEYTAYGIGAGASDESSIIVNTQSVTAEAKSGTEVIGISAGTSGQDASVEINVDRNVTVTGSETDLFSFGAGIQNEGGTVILNVGGDIDATEARALSAINDSANSGADSSLTQVTVEGNISSTNTGHNVGVHLGSGTEDDKIIASVGGNVTASGDSGSGITVSGEGGSVEAVISGNLSAEAVESVSGLDLETYDAMSSSITIGGNTTAKSDDSSAYAIHVLSKNDTKDSITVSGNVTAEAKSGSATGVVADISGTGAQADIRINGDVSVTSADDPWGTSRGAVIYNTGSDVSLESGSISVKAQGEDMEAQGIRISADSQSTTVIDTGDSGISVTNTGNGEAYGMIISASEDSSAAVDTQRLAVEAKNGSKVTGIDADTSGEDSRITIDVGADVTVTGSDTDMMSEAVEIDNEGGTVILNIGGDIDAAEARALSVVNDSAESGSDSSLTQITVGGDITSQDTGFNCGVHLGTAGDGDQISASFGGDITVTGDAGCGIDVSGGGGSIVTAVAGDISVKVTNRVTALETEIGNGLNAAISVGGDITAESEESDAFAVLTRDTKDSKADLTIAGDVTAVSKNGSAYGVVTIGSGSETNVVIDGNVSAAGTGNTSGVEIHNDGSNVHLQTGGSITAESQGNDAEAQGVNVETSGPAASVIEAGNGSITAIAAGQSEACGIDAYAADGGSIVINAQSVTAAAEKGSKATGIDADSFGEGSRISIDVSQDVSVTGSDTDMMSQAVVINNEGGTVILNVGGNINATEARALSVVNDSKASEASSSMTQITVEGDITSQDTGFNCGVHLGTSGDGDQINASFGGDIIVTGDAGCGIDVSGGGGSIVTAVAGDISAKVTNRVTALETEIGNGLNAAISVGGDIVAESEESDAFAILTRDTKDSKADLTISGDVTAVSKSGSAYGLMTTGSESETNVLVEGNVSAEAAGEAGQAHGIEVTSSAGQGKVSITVMDGISAQAEAGISASAIKIDHFNYSNDKSDNSEVNVEVTGNVQSTGTGIYVQTEDTAADGSVRVEVKDGNVQADETGIFLMGNQTMDVIVDGTVQGKSSSVLVEGTVSDMTLTVWEIKPDDEGNYVESIDWLPGDPGPTTSAEEDIAKEIQYIIRLQPNDHASLSASGTTEYEGYQVAREDDKVILKIDIQKGYELVGAYGDVDQNVQLLKGDDGNYYLVVPRGGGVLLSAKLRRIAPPKKQLTITFDPHGGTLRNSTEPFSVSAFKGDTIALPEAPEKEDGEFLGWYGTPYSADDPRWTAPEGGSAELLPAGSEVLVNEDYFYTAIWQEAAAESDS